MTKRKPESPSSKIPTTPLRRAKARHSAAERLMLTVITDESAPLENEPLYGKVYRLTREALLSGALAPGDMLNSRPVAQALGMSTMPVREAMGRLVADGVLESLANRAFRVPLINRDGFNEIFLMRLRLETLAGEHAAVRAGRDDLSELQSLLDRMRASHDSIDEYLAAHRRFHFRIYRAAGMPMLANAIESLWLRIGPLLQACSGSANLEAEDRYHAEMLRAIKSADPIASSRAIQDDLVDASGHVIDYLATLQYDSNSK